jgi:hypothetical protein
MKKMISTLVFSGTTFLSCYANEWSEIEHLAKKVAEQKVEADIATTRFRSQQKLVDELRSKLQREKVSLARINEELLDWSEDEQVSGERSEEDLILFMRNHESRQRLAQTRIKDLEDLCKRENRRLVTLKESEARGRSIKSARSKEKREQGNIQVIRARFNRRVRQLALEELEKLKEKDPLEPIKVEFSIQNEQSPSEQKQEEVVVSIGEDL